MGVGLAAAPCLLVSLSGTVHCGESSRLEEGYPQRLLDALLAVGARFLEELVEGLGLLDYRFALDALKRREDLLVAVDFLQLRAVHHQADDLIIPPECSGWNGIPTGHGAGHGASPFCDMRM